MVSRTFLGKAALVLVCVSVVVLGACSDDEPKQQQKAVATDPKKVFDGGRDPFGAEAAAWEAHNSGNRPDASSDEGVCSNFSLTVVGPFQQIVGEQAVFYGHAQDDQHHEFEFSWSASTGELTDKKGQMTKHTCSEPGISTISMTASAKGVCTSAVAHVVTCLVPKT